MPSVARTVHGQPDREPKRGHRLTVTPIGGDKPTIGSNAIAIAMETGSTSPGR